MAGRKVTKIGFTRGGGVTRKVKSTLKVGGGRGGRRY